MRTQVSLLSQWDDLDAMRAEEIRQIDDLLKVCRDIAATDETRRDAANRRIRSLTALRRRWSGSPTVIREVGEC